LDWIGCELYNLGSYWIFLLWIMNVDPFPRIYVPAPGRRRRAGTRAYHARTAPAGHRTPGVGIGTERREQTSAHFTVHSMSSRASKKSRRGCMSRAPIPIPPALPYRIPPTRGDGPLRHVPGGGLALSACGLRAAADQAVSSLVSKDSIRCGTCRAGVWHSLPAGCGLRLTKLCRHSSARTVYAAARAGRGSGTLCLRAAGCG
jgi:hypothetical protein